MSGILRIIEKRRWLMIFSLIAFSLFWGGPDSQREFTFDFIKQGVRWVGKDNKIGSAASHFMHSWT
jgi:hypothetical protein